MVDYSKLQVEETDDFTTSRGRGAENPVFPLFEQALADGKPRAIRGLNIKDKSDPNGELSEFLQVARDCASAAQKIKRVNEGKGKIEASVKKEVVDGIGIVRFKAKWIERYATEQNGTGPDEDAVEAVEKAQEPVPARGRRRGAAE